MSILIEIVNLSKLFILLLVHLLVYGGIKYIILYINV